MWLLHSGQEAKVRITAYDSSLYGALPGVVDRVGVDTLITEDQRSYYPVIVKADPAVAASAHRSMPIIAGMVANVNIVTGTRSVLDYVLKPVLKLREESLVER